MRLQILNKKEQILFKKEQILLDTYIELNKLKKDDIFMTDKILELIERYESLELIKNYHNIKRYHEASQIQKKISELEFKRDKILSEIS